MMDILISIFLFAPAVKVPLAILGAEIDRTSPPELVKQFEVILSEKSEVQFSISFF